MKFFIHKTIVFVIALFMGLVLIGCSISGYNNCKTPEKVELKKVVLNEVEFENGEAVSLSQECDEVVIKGTIDAMTTAQKSAFGDGKTTHMVAIKITFDKERTLDQVEIKGEKIKVYATDKNVENYVGSLTELLDNDKGDDASCDLVLSANTKNYTIKAIYTDDKENDLKIKIDATLATSSEE